MESQYRQFVPDDGSLVQEEHRMTTKTGLKSLVIYILYSILVLLLLILLMVTGIKFSQLNKDITDVKLQLETIKQRFTSPSSSDKIKGPQASTTATEDIFDELVPVRGTCREGWISFQTSCYLLSTAAVPWNRAEEQCTSLRGHLLVLNSMKELVYISRVVKMNQNYWIGLVERQQEGHWSWVDGTDFQSTPKFWDLGQPDNWELRENGEDCGQIHSTARRKLKRWNDADCSLSYRFICEAKA